MIHQADYLLIPIGLALAGFMLYRNFWRAILCIAPSTLEVDAEDPPDRMKVPRELSPMAEQLGALGFVPIGTRREKPKFAAAMLFHDFACPNEGVFATLSLGRDLKPCLYFLTRTEQDGFVITANYRRPAKEIPGRYLAGSLDDFPPVRVYKAHLKRIGPLARSGDYTQAGRLEAAEAWYAGPGRSEIRQQNLQGLVWTVGTLGILAAAVFGKR